jgi:hypothetical protein
VFLVSVPLNFNISTEIGKVNFAVFVGPLCAPNISHLSECSWNLMRNPRMSTLSLSRETKKSTNPGGNGARGARDVLKSYSRATMISLKAFDQAAISGNSTFPVALAAVPPRLCAYMGDIGISGEGIWQAKRLDSGQQP